MNLRALEVLEVVLHLWCWKLAVELLPHFLNRH